MTTEPTTTFRPYAPPANVVTVLQRLRRMNVPPRISREFLLGSGVSDNLISRVASTLRFLGLISDQDEPTDTLRALAVATDEEYRSLLADTIRMAYAADFQNINPATDQQQRIQDTFQRYKPGSQHSRQVMLLLGLCREAGMEVLDAPRDRPMQTPASKQRAAAKKTRTSKSVTGRPMLDRGATTGNPPASGTFFGLEEDDLVHLDEADFHAVWGALGKVALAKMKAKRAASSAGDFNEDDGGDEE